MLPAPSFGTRLVLRENKKNEFGLCPVCIVVTIKGKRITHSTGLRVKVEQWEAGRVVRHPNAVHYNARIAEKLATIEAELLTARPSDIIEAKTAIAHDDGLFLDYARKALLEMEVSEPTRRRWTVILDHVKTHDQNVRWSQITPAWLTKFNKYLISPKTTYVDGKKKVTPGQAQSTARIALVCLRRIFNYARDNKVTRLYPFSDFNMPVIEESRRQYLTLDETDRIKALLGRNDFTKPMHSVIAYFLLECYSGLRHSDWGKWQTEKLIDGESLYLNTTKTGEQIYLPLENSPKLAFIIGYIRERNFVPLTNQAANRILREIGRHAGIEKPLTTHVARHTCATLLLEKGFSIETVAQVLGVSLKIVQIYAKMTGQKVKLEFGRIGGL